MVVSRFFLRFAASAFLDVLRTAKLTIVVHVDWNYFSFMLYIYMYIVIYKVLCMHKKMF